MVLGDSVDKGENLGGTREHKLYKTLEMFEEWKRQRVEKDLD